MPETTLSQISEHVYWMSPGLPDRPSMCAIVGSQHTLIVEAAASVAHMRLFLDALAGVNVPTPHYVALTHWHWDHVFGATALDVPIMAHVATAEQLAILATYDWSDAALDQRVATGEEIAFCADNIKLELPEPRDVHIVLPDIVFHDRLDVRLGGATCRIQHVGGDHAADASVIYVEPDRVLFLGDCLYEAIYTPVRHYTTQKLYPLLDTVLSFDAEYFIEGHNDTVLMRADIEARANKMRLIGALVDRIGTDESAVLAETGQPSDEDTQNIVQAFIAGKRLSADA